MTDSQENDSSGAFPCKIFPLMHFSADWPLDRYDFDLGVSLVRASPEHLGRMSKLAFADLCDGSDDFFYGSVEWLLIIPWLSEIDKAGAWVPTENEEQREATEEDWAQLDAAPTGPPSPPCFAHEPRKLFRTSFMTALSVVKSNTAAPRLEFTGFIDKHEVRVKSADKEWSLYWPGNSPAPLVFMPIITPYYHAEGFDESDLTRLHAVWDGLVELKGLRDWFDPASCRRFFNDVEEKANQAVENRKPKGDQRIEDDTRECYREEFSRCWHDRMRETENRTRLGRAVTLFEQGLHLPPLHAFLSMCLVLETLYTAREGGVAYNLATRLARVLGAGEGRRMREYYRTAREVYRRRSDVIHGRKLFDCVKEPVRKDAFILARESLERILCDSELLGIFSSKETSDKFLKDLDLGIK